MLRLLASGFLTRKLARPIARAIPNPLLRTVAIAATGYAVDRVLSRRTAASSAPRKSLKKR